MDHPLFDGGAPRPGGYRDITVAQLEASLGSVRLVDVREPHEFTGELGHIEGAELVPLGTLVTAAAAWPREADLVLICRSGNRSGRGAAQLASMGFSRMMNMEGGMLAWNAAAFPVKR